MAAIFSAAVPLPPEMIAPAWPMRRPGGAVCPAINPTTGFFMCVRNKLRGSLFCVAADFSDHDHGLSLRVAVEQIERVDKVRGQLSISANADRRRLPDSALRQLMHRLIRQRSGARDDSDVALFVNRRRHDANFAFTRRDDAGQFGRSGRERRFLQKLPGADHVEGRNALVMQTMSSISASAAP